jgi:hypothetical protein
LFHAKKRRQKVSGLQTGLQFSRRIQVSVLIGRSTFGIGFVVSGNVLNRDAVNFAKELNGSIQGRATISQVASQSDIGGRIHVAPKRDIFLTSTTILLF